MCEDKELLVGYLYDDLRMATARGSRRTCAGARSCRDELKALRGVRADLADVGAARARLRLSGRPRRTRRRGTGRDPARRRPVVARVVDAGRRPRRRRGPRARRRRRRSRTSKCTAVPTASRCGPAGPPPLPRQPPRPAGTSAARRRGVPAATSGSAVDVGRRVHRRARAPADALEAASSRDSGVRNASTLSARVVGRGDHQARPRAARAERDRAAG